MTMGLSMDTTMVLPSRSRMSSSSEVIRKTRPRGLMNGVNPQEWYPSDVGFSSQT